MMKDAISEYKLGVTVILAWSLIIACFLVVKLNKLDQKIEQAVREAGHANTEAQILHVKLAEANKKIDSLLTLTQPKVKTAKKPFKRVKKDSAETAHIERVIYHELVRAGMDSSMSRIVVAIAKHESRSFESALFNGTNNLFGMTYPPRRQTLAVGHKIYLDNGNIRRFCTFNSVSEATRDMVLYLKHWKYPLDIQTPEQMVRLMKSKRYFEAPETVYLKAVKRHLSQLTI